MVYKLILTVALVLAWPWSASAAVSFTAVASVANGTNTNSYATGAFTPVADRLYVFVGNQTDSAIATTPSISCANGLSPVAVTPSSGSNPTPHSSIGTPGQQLTVHRALETTGGGLSSNTCTWSFSADNQTGFLGLVIEVAGVVTTGTQGADAIAQVVMAAADSTANPSVTLSAFSSAQNGTLFAVGVNSISAIAEDSGWTQIGTDLNHNSPASGLFVAARADNDTAATATLSGTPSWAAVGIEIVAEPTAGGSPNRLMPLLLGVHE